MLKKRETDYSTFNVRQKKQCYNRAKNIIGLLIQEILLEGEKAHLIKGIMSNPYLDHG